MTLTPSTNDQLVAMAAHRYCLGRQSYIVGACLEWLRATWGDFTPNTRQVILRDTVEALMDEHAGSEGIDVPGWQSFAQWGWDQIDLESKVWIRSAVAHKSKPFPLSSPKTVHLAQSESPKETQ